LWGRAGEGGAFGEQVPLFPDAPPPTPPHKGEGSTRSPRHRCVSISPQRALAGALVAAALAALCAAARAQAPGELKSLTIVVGSSPGGGYDIYARLLARHMSRHLRGAPSIIVQNLPGASSLKAVQYLDANAPKDGSVIAAFNPGLITESLLKAEKLRFKFSEVAFVGSITRDLRACYAWGATGIRSWDDLKRAKQFNLGAPAPGTSSFINASMLKNLFGIAVHQVTGYAGSAQTRLAIERGELDGDCGAWSSVPQDWVANNKINPLLKFTRLPIPGLAGDVPYAGDLAPSEETRNVLDLLTAPDALGRPYVVSRQVRPARLAMLRTAFDKTMADAQFLAEAEKLDLPVSGAVEGSQAEAIIAAIDAASPALVARARNIVGR
jgi:tripartite-type tricarboxylate transporter receptor subunit TctC